MKCSTGMRGDFLGEANLAWEDLEIGRESDLTLLQRKGVQGGTVKGTIKLLVGEPMVEVVDEEEGIVVGNGVAAVTDQQAAGSVTVKEVGVVWTWENTVTGGGRQDCGIPRTIESLRAHHCTASCTALA